MARIRQIGMAAGTFSVALGIGFVMQNGDALASRFGSDSSAAEPAPFTMTETVDDAAVAAASIDEAQTPIQLEQANFLSTQAPEVIAPDADMSLAVALPQDARLPVRQDAPVQLANLDPDALVGLETAATTEVDCAPQMNATAAVAAMIEVTITAPCHVSTPFTVHHQGMMFTAMTNGDGISDLTVPALAEVSVTIAAFADGNGAVASTVVPDFGSYDRAVLQWQGNTSVNLSAYEDGAHFGEATHINFENPGDLSRLSSATGGYLVRLGEETQGDALTAEVYTFPTGMMPSAPDVMLMAEAEITADNCGRELNAQSIQISPAGESSALDLRMIMPECDAVGDFLILQNMFADLTLASR